MPHFEIKAGEIFTLFGLPVTNTILAAWLASAVLIGLSFLATRRMTLVPGRLQNIAEAIVETLLSVAVQTADERRGRRFVPIIGTLFLFILTANWMGILPGFGEGEIYMVRHVGEHEEHVSLLRSANSDISVTAAMALVVFVLVEMSGLRAGGVHYLAEFLWPGLLIEVISHIARPVALALRLFGNILAGEILLTVMSSQVPLVVPALFMGFEMFVGIVQALIFSLLTLAFLTLSTEHEVGHHEGSERAHQPPEAHRPHQATAS